MGLAVSNLSENFFQTNKIIIAISTILYYNIVQSKRFLPAVITYLPRLKEQSVLNFLKSCF